MLPRRVAAFRATRCRIGLLGGSFNPAHGGHRHLSMEAIRHLGLDGVWWLVSPQNPLKKTDGMAPLAKRMASARRTARHPKLMVTDLETRLGTVYTADTLRRLTRLFPHVRFVWLMGADNLIQISRWERWNEIFKAVPIAVFARPSYCLRALASVAAHRFDRFRIKERRGAQLADLNAPRWVFLHTRLHPASATRIRAAAALGQTIPHHER
jgi:nicotinate-nucleotide adenylyltransferase